MKIRISLLLAVFLIGITMYSCSNSDEIPEEEIVAEEDEGDDAEEDAGDADEETENENEDGSDDETDEDSDGEGSSEDQDDSEDEDNDDGEGEDNGDGEDEGTGDEEGTSDGEDTSEDEDTEDEEPADTTAPSIVFITPLNGDSFEEGSNITVNAEVTDEAQVAFARLFLNGALVRQENVTPYEWGRSDQSDAALSDLGPGSYDLRVVAEDEFGNVNENTISITIEEAMDNGSDNGDTGGNDQNGATSCDNPEDAVFIEEDGLVVAEFENNLFNGAWQFRTNEPNFSGEGFMVWTGSQSFNDPGNGLVRFSIQIQNPGTYRFVWRSAVTIGDSGSEHNDTWLRFPDANDFFGRRNGSTIFPNGTGKTPNPNGSSSDGWFKVYRSGGDLGFKWQSSTSDNDAHSIFITFNSPGVYTMEISARSSGHAIDKFVLFNEDNFSFNEATSSSNPISEVDCN